MFLKILWVLDAIILIAIIAGIILEKPENGIFAYVILYIGLIASSYWIRESRPKWAIFLAGIPVALPLLIVLFLAIIANLSNVLK